MHHQPRQAHSERLWHTCTPCTHAARTCMPRSRPNHMHPGTSSVADQRTRATWEARCISARCRRRCAEDECTCWCSARRPLLVADRFVHGRGPWPCTNPVAEVRRGRTAAQEVHSTSVTKRSVPRNTDSCASWHTLGLGRVDVGTAAPQVAACSQRREPRAWPRAQHTHKPAGRTCSATPATGVAQPNRSPTLDRVTCVRERPASPVTSECAVLCNKIAVLCKKIEGRPWYSPAPRSQVP